MALASTITLFGCTSTGTARGQLVTANGQTQYVTFVWRSDAGDLRRGSLSVLLPSGQEFAGSYRQVSHTYPVSFYGPMWTGWQPYWPDWRPYWYAGPMGWDGPRWVRVYEGRVIARLEAQNSPDYMRCRFSLEDPSKGLSGGGSGDCQISTGETIRKAVLAPEP